VSSLARLLRGPLPALMALAAVTVSALPANARATADTATTTDAGTAAAQGRTVTRGGEWWLTALNVPGAWREAPTAGRGVTVAVLSTGVDARHPDLSGSVTEGPDLSQTGRAAGSPYWGAEGTAVASLIAGHGHGHGGEEGITGVAPGARILSVQVTLEYNDPLNSDAAITRRLPDAIAKGIMYAVSHGATVIALPLDPGTLGSVTKGDPAAAGGSAAERAAVDFALDHGVLLVAPAGDNGAATNVDSYPAGYGRVIAVGATARNGQLSPFTSLHSYVQLTAPGSGVIPVTPVRGGAVANPALGLTVAAPGGGYESLASTDMASALTAGVAALIRARYPQLTVAEVTQALDSGARLPAAKGKAASGKTTTTGKKASGKPAQAEQKGRGFGELDAAVALTAAASIAAAHAAPAATSSAPAQPGGPAPSPVALETMGRSDPGRVIKTFVVVLLAGAAALSALLAAVLALTRFRRRTRSTGSPKHAPTPHTATHARGSRVQQHRPTLPAGRALPRAISAPKATIPGSVELATPRWPDAAATPWPPAAPSDSGAALTGTIWATAGSGVTAAKEIFRKSGGSQHRHGLTEKPPWPPAAPPESPGPATVMTPPPARPASEPRPPWERYPDAYTTSPLPLNAPPVPVSNTGPMYIWNPGTTGPLPALENFEEP
jgi:subtilisin family serine protease